MQNTLKRAQQRVGRTAQFGLQDKRTKSELASEKRNERKRLWCNRMNKMETRRLQSGRLTRQLRMLKATTKSSKVICNYFQTKITLR